MKQVSVGRLRNGMLYYSYLDCGFHLGGVGVKAGSVHDPPGKRGLAHLSEHCVFSGSNNYPAHVVDLKYFEGHMGGPDAGANVRTFFTSTVYSHDNLLRRNHALDCFGMIADLIKSPIINATVVATEKAAVHNEYYLNGMDSAQARATDMARGLLYVKNPAGNRIDAELPEFEHITVRDVRNFIRRYNVPRNMFALFLGPEYRQVKQIAERHFADWGASTTPIVDYDDSDNVPVLRSIRSAESSFPGIGQHHFVMAWPTEVYGSKDEEAVEILCRIFARRLRNRLRGANTDFNKGVYRVFVTPERSMYHGAIYMWFATVGDSDVVREYEEIVLQEAKRLGNELVSRDEMETMRKSLERQHRESFNTVALNLAELVIEAAANGDEELVGLSAYLTNLCGVNRRKVREVARKYLVPQYVRVLVRPE